MAFNYYYRYDPNNVYSNMKVHGKNNRRDRSIISQVRKIRQKKEGLLDDEIYEDKIDYSGFALRFYADCLQQ